MKQASIETKSVTRCDKFIPLAASRRSSDIFCFPLKRWCFSVIHVQCDALDSDLGHLLSLNSFPTTHATSTDASALNLWEAVRVIMTTNYDHTGMMQHFFLANQKIDLSDNSSVLSLRTQNFCGFCWLQGFIWSSGGYCHSPREVIAFVGERSFSGARTEVAVLASCQKYSSWYMLFCKKKGWCRECLQALLGSLSTPMAMAVWFESHSCHLCWET